MRRKSYASPYIRTSLPRTFAWKHFECQSSQGLFRTQRSGEPVLQIVRMNNKAGRLKPPFAIDCASVEGPDGKRRDRGWCNTPQRQINLKCHQAHVPRSHLLSNKPRYDFSTALTPDCKSWQSRLQCLAVGIQDPIQSVFPQGFWNGGKGQGSFTDEDRTAKPRKNSRAHRTTKLIGQQSAAEFIAPLPNNNSPLNLLP